MLAVVREAMGLARPAGGVSVLDVLGPGPVGGQPCGPAGVCALAVAVGLLPAGVETEQWAEPCVTASALAAGGVQ